ncbi:protein kinase domain-containing protein [Paenibacillus cymbidii]|uniref:protein kinase domain-containing protein n=1 Tax=Paenibacillus cymbidii TaxID=1639034 RepID=UPI001436A8EE|nr:protein kinase [Paenibacillus cymbidii]
MEWRSRIAVGDCLAGRYRVTARIGSGGMSQVYAAEDMKLPGKRWAVKECDLHRIHPQRLQAEAELLMRLSHPNLPHIVDYVPPDERGFGYIVMEYVDGRTLQQVVEEDGAMSWPAAVSIALQLCEAFGYLHGVSPQPIIYRDLKPANVMLGDSGNVKLIDFGIARTYRSDCDADTLQLGTAGFAAPEQYEGGQTDARTDLFALGALLHYLLSGGGRLEAGAAPQPLYRAEVPDALVQAIRRLTRTLPSQRPQSAAATKQLLEQALAGEDASDEALKLRPGKTSAERRLIVVGGLYAGAGATFCALAIAAALRRRSVPHALLEFPTAEPELYHLLYGDRYAPKQYRFAATAALQQAPYRNRWTNGSTEWLPLPPDRPLREEWNDGLTYKLLHLAQQPVVVADLSHCWCDPLAAELCRAADELIVVADPFPSRWTKPSTRRNAEAIDKLRAEGKPVRYVANRETPFGQRREWLDLFPVQPSVLLPVIPPEQMAAESWQGKPGSIWQHVALQEQLEPLLDKLLPAAWRSGSGDPAHRSARRWWKTRLSKNIAAKQPERG